MSLHPIDFFYEHAGHVLRPYMRIDPAEPGDRCGVCGRTQDLWSYPNDKVVFTQYGITEAHCLPCHSLFEGSIELFGVERLAKGTPVPMKLGMATGCGALITPEKTTLFLNGFIDKMDKAEKPPFEMLRLSGKAAHQSVIDNPPDADQYLYIGNFGRKKADLVSNLKLSGRRVLRICEESACSEIPLASMKALREASAGLPVSLINSTRRILADIYRGNLAPDDGRVVKQLETVQASAPQLTPALRQLPVDPHQTLHVLRLW